MYRSELEMSKEFERFLKARFGNSYVKEYQGLFGIPDFIFYAKAENKILVISFELKLKDWKRAAKQAFRYRSFSNASYVIMPRNSVNKAVENISLFSRYNLGLASFDHEHDFRLLFRPESSKPFSISLNERFLYDIRHSRKQSKNYNELLS